MPSKALESAKQKGRDAFRVGKKRTENPYPDKRCNYKNSVTFSRAFRKWWEDGYDEAAKEQPNGD